MLILSRRPGESIIIGKGKDKIIVVVTDVEGPTVRIGIDAPADVEVNREEVYNSKSSSNSFSRGD